MKELKRPLPEHIRFVEKVGHNRLWLFRCSCGKEFKALMTNVRSGNTKSCGCRRSAVTRERVRTHGMTGSPIYRIWSGMVRRCTNPKNPAYHNYGGRGIVVSEDWMKFENFFKDMGTPPLKLTLERVNNNGPYSKENCVWATRKAQNLNRRDNRMVTINGETHPVAFWAERAGIPHARLLGRLRLGWSGVRLLNLKTWERAKEALA